MEEENKTKKNSSVLWPSLSLVSAILVFLWSMIIYSLLPGDPKCGSINITNVSLVLIPPFIPIIFGLIALKKKQEKSISLAGIILGVIVLLIWIFIYSGPSYDVMSCKCNRGGRSKDGTIIGNIRELSTIAEIFAYENNDNYFPLCNKDNSLNYSINERLKILSENIIGCGSPAIKCYSTSTAYCVYTAEPTIHNSSSSGWYCADSKRGGVFIYDTEPKTTCSPMSWTCE